MHNTRREVFLSYLVWAVTAIFFAFQFSLRNSHGLYVDELVTKYNISATSFSLFSSMFYVAYSLMQIPAGILLDAKQPKYIIPAFIVLYSLSALSFAYTDNFTIAVISRILMGVGATFGFLGCSKIVSIYFKKEDYNFMISLSFTAGFLGAMYGGKPVAKLIEILGWHGMFNVLSGVGIFIAIISYMLIKPVEKSESDCIKSVFKDALYVLKNKNILFVAICGSLMMGPTEGFADAWGVKYLMQLYELDRQTASFITSMIYFGLCFGGPFLIKFAENIKSDYIAVIIAGFTMTCLTAALLIYDNISIEMLYIICFVIVIMCGSQVLIFGINNTYVDQKYSAIAAAVTNCIVMSSGTFIHTGIGLLIDYFGSILGYDSAGGVFGTEQIRYALSIVPILMIIGTILVCGRVFYKNNAK